MVGGVAANHFERRHPAATRIALLTPLTEVRFHVSRFTCCIVNGAWLWHTARLECRVRATLTHGIVE